MPYFGVYSLPFCNGKQAGDDSMVHVFHYRFSSSLTLQAYARGCLLHFCQLPVLQGESKLAGDDAKHMTPSCAAGYSTGVL